MTRIDFSVLAAAIFFVCFGVASMQLESRFADQAYMVDINVQYISKVTPINPFRYQIKVNPEMELLYIKVLQGKVRLIFYEWVKGQPDKILNRIEDNHKEIIVYVNQLFKRPLIDCETTVGYW